MPIWFFTLYHNSYFAVCNELNLLPQVLYSVTMLRTFGMYLRAHDCKYRESLARLKKSKILIICQKTPLGN